MANNRMFLVHRPTKYAIFLGKRMEGGWYTNGKLSSELMDEFYRAAYKDSDHYDQDDFEIVMESPEHHTEVRETNYGEGWTLFFQDSGNVKTRKL